MKMNEKYDILKIDNQFCFSVYALSKEITRLYKPFLKKIDLTYTIKRYDKNHNYLILC